MNEYIKREDLMNAFKNLHQYKYTRFCSEMEKGNSYIDAGEAFAVMEELDTVLAEPITIGFWRKISPDKLDGRFACSACGRQIDILTGVQTPYDRGFRRCNCGAIMAKGTVIKADLRECVEVCPHCLGENIILWNPEKLGYVVRCIHCGKEMMLCDECRHDDNCGVDCDWRQTSVGGKCRRGETRG